MFTRCRFQIVPVRILFSKSTIFEGCRQKMCCFRVHGRCIRHIFHHFQNVLALCERSLRNTLTDQSLVYLIKKRHCCACLKMVSKWCVDVCLKDKSGVDKIIVKKQPYQLLKSNRESFPSFDASNFHKLVNESS